MRRLLRLLAWLLPPLTVVMLFDWWNERQNKRVWREGEESWERVRTAILEAWAEEDGVAVTELEPMIKSAGLWDLRGRFHGG